MGHGPDLKRKIGDSTANEKLLNDAIKKCEDELGNSYEKGIAYINRHTTGILTDENGQMVGEIINKTDSYTKFSESYSLEKLTPIIDGTVKFAVDYLEGGEEGANASKMAGDVGKVVKGILSLFASSSTTNKNLNQIFAQFRKGEDNYAIYYASNSGTVAAQNAWGNKDLIVITNIYIFAQVNENPAIGKAELRQHILDNIKKAKELFSDALLNAGFDDDKIAKIESHQKMIKALEEEYTSELT